MGKKAVQASFLMPLRAFFANLSAMDIGDRIRAFRRARGLTQVQLARAVGVDKSAVAQWESPGRARKGITIGNLQAVAEVLAIPVSELLADADAVTEAVKVVDPTEMAVIRLLRRLPRKQREAHLGLLYASIEIGDGSEAPGEPQKRRPVRRRGPIKHAT